MRAFWNALPVPAQCLAILIAWAWFTPVPWLGRLFTVALLLGLTHEQADEVLIFFLVFFLGFWPLDSRRPPSVLLDLLYLRGGGGEILEVLQLFF